MTITTNDDRDEYTATSGQTVFSYTFKIYASSDLNVYQTPAAQDFDDAADIITGYSVSGVGSASGGTITLNTGATNGDRITIVSAIPSSRTVDYQTNGDFVPATVNEDIDRSVSLAKQAEGLAKRSPKFAESRQGVSEFTLPKPVANNFWRVKSDLSGLESYEIPSADLSSTNAIYTFNSVAAMVASTDLTIGIYVQTLGYYSADDGGGNFYQIVVAGTGTDDGGSFIDLATHQAKGLFPDKKIKVVQFGGVADDVSQNGTDISSNIQAAIDYFDGARGEVWLMAGNSYSGSGIDFKRCSLVGYGDGDSAGSGDDGDNYTVLRFDGTNGISTTIEDNTGPHHRDFRVTATNQDKTANGQTLIDFTGVNRPRLSRVVSRGGENGLVLDAGASVECHYGHFEDYYPQKHHRGIKILGGAETQTHSFFGGRAWDCVVAYENAEGTSDINFYGTTFESDLAIKHTDAGSNPQAAETKTHGCRDESSSIPDIPVGVLTQLGTYWSGNRKASYLTFGAGTTSEIENRLNVYGVANNKTPSGRNILKNPSFTPDLNDDTVVPGWAATTGVPIQDTHKGASGRIVELSGIDATSRTALLTQTGISVKAGWYSYGVTLATSGSVSTFTTELNNNGVALVNGVDFEGDAINTTGGNIRSLRIKFLSDFDQINFEMKVAAVNNTDYVYFYEPYFIEGRHAELWSEVNPLGFGQYHVSAIPTTGAFKIGDIAWNTTVTVAGSASSQYIIVGWRRLTDGTAHVLNTDWVEMRTLTGT